MGSNDRRLPNSAELERLPIESLRSLARRLLDERAADRQRVEEELRDSAERLGVALDAAQMGTWDWDLASGRIEWSEQHEALCGYAPGTFPGTAEAFTSRIPEADLVEMWRVGDEALRTRARFRVEYRVTWPDGSVHWLASLGGYTYDPDGRPVRLGGVVYDITDRKGAEEALRASEERFRSLIEGAPEAIFVQTDGRFRYVNTATVTLLGAGRADDLLGREMFEVVAPEFHPAVRRRMAAQRQSGGAVPPMEQEYVCLDGTRVPVETTAVTIRFEGRDGHLVFVRDISERRKAEVQRALLEDELQQAQKLESVGRLAGGVAHDFNNLLFGIMSHAELCREALGDDHPVRAHLDAITDAAQRSAGITRQLLTFARKQAIAPIVMDLNHRVADTLNLLQRLIGENVELVWRPDASEPLVCMDPTQVDQVLANLAVNARDAIDGVGRITVQTTNEDVGDDVCAAHPGVVPGPHVVLAVRDTGAGMDAATQARIFEPFFTTKPAGQGTGLGLPMVYGIVQQNGGFITVDSQPGAGTTFRLFLPRHVDVARPPDVPVAPPALRGGDETILLVEDERVVRVAAELVLKALGYSVLVAETPEQALALVSDHPGPIHLVLTDVIMPGMNGRALAATLVERFPGLRCLFVSGYPADVIGREGVLDPGVHFLAKPFSRAHLAARIREVLDAPRP